MKNVPTYKENTAIILFFSTEIRIEFICFWYTSWMNKLRYSRGTFTLDWKSVSYILGNAAKASFTEWNYAIWQNAHCMPGLGTCNNLKYSSVIYFFTHYICLRKYFMIKQNWQNTKIKLPICIRGVVNIKKWFTRSQSK